MADAYRDLIQHPELLTVECECRHDEDRAYCGRCYTITGPSPLDGRRPKTLEELLEAIKDRTRHTRGLSQSEKDYAPIQRSIAFSYDWDGAYVEVEVDAAGAHSTGGAIIRDAQGATEWEAVARLLIELEGVRGR